MVFYSGVRKVVTSVKEELKALSNILQKNVYFIIWLFLTPNTDPVKFVIGFIFERTTYNSVFSNYIHFS